MIKFINKYKHLFWFLLFVPTGVLYFITSHLICERHLIHLSFDNSIPFIPAFIIPYIIWYLYIPLPMAFTALLDKNQFKYEIISLFSGIFICFAIFLIYPTYIDFRPQITSDTFLLRLCGIIFSNDNPVNVFPSLHCYEAASIHFSIFVFGKYKDKYLLRVFSAVIMVLIVLSTVFVKQHSYIDLIVGTLMAPPICYFVKKLYFKGNMHNDNQSV